MTPTVHFLAAGAVLMQPRSSFVRGLETVDRTVALAADLALVLAVPAWVADPDRPAHRSFLQPTESAS